MQEATLKYQRTEVLTPTAQLRAWTPSLGHLRVDTLAKPYVSFAQTKHVWLTTSALCLSWILATQIVVLFCKGVLAALTQRNLQPAHVPRRACCTC